MNVPKYSIMYHDYETNKTEMVGFNWWIGRLFFMLTTARKAFWNERVQLIDTKES